MLLASCGGGGGSSSTPSTPSSSGSTPASTKVNPEEVIKAIADQEDVDLLVWCAKEISPAVTNTVNDFLDQLKEWGYEGELTAQINEVGEGDAATKMVTDVEAGADVYFFAQDQLARLNTAGALAEVPAAFQGQVKAENSAGSINAATLSDKVMAYPATDDNGYYLYYDKSVLSPDDVKDWETIIAKAEAQSKEVDFNYSSAWYNFGFFYAAGADSVWETNAAGDFVGYNDTYASEKGLIAAKAMRNIITSPRVVDNSSVSGAGETCIALVDGTWDYNAAVEKWGDNLGCAELPYFTVDGQRYHTASFSGNKLIGVKPQATEARAVVAHLVGLELNGYEAQEARYDLKGWGPSNLELAASEKIAAAPHLQALIKQNAYAKPQGQFPGKWWDLAGGIGTYIFGKGKEATDAELQAGLDTYYASLDTCLDA